MEKPAGAVTLTEPSGELPVLQISSVSVAPNVPPSTVAGGTGPKVALSSLLDGADVADATYKPATAPMHPSTRSDFATPDGRPVNNRRMYLPPH